MRIGVDLGGTKVEAVLLLDDGKEALRQRVNTPRGSYAQIVDAVVALVLDIERQAMARCAVGIGIPGTISSATGLVKNANSTELNGHPLHHDLSERLNRPVRVENDANCFALSEAVDGAAAALSGPRSVVFGVIIGTGVGGGLVVGRELIIGPDGIAGEWGHTPLPWLTDCEAPGPECWCGRRACIETFLSGPGLARDHQERTGQVLKASEVAARAAAGDSDAEQTLVRYEHRLARGLAGMINVLNPVAIVLGGGVSNIQRLYENVPKLWGDFAFSDVVSTRLLPAQHGDSSGVRGAAWLNGEY